MFYIDDDLDALVLDASGVHPKARCQIDFQRTLRIPDDNQEYPLPPGLGSFPLHHVDDYQDEFSESWKKHGGIFFPMWQAEALWLNFHTQRGYPFAIKIAAGKINAVSGDPWSSKLVAGDSRSKRQDYVVTPNQKWLDGYCVGEGVIRQFVAMPLGSGYTAEEQRTGEAVHGGIQIIAYPMKAERYEEHMLRVNRAAQLVEDLSYTTVRECDAIVCCAQIGLAPGGLMRQEVFEDEYGIDAWDQGHPSRCFVHILNSREYQEITGEAPPDEPLSAKVYTDAGFPWFDHYSESNTALEGAKSLAGLDSVAAKGIKKGQKPLPENVPITPGKIVSLGDKLRKMVREGAF